MRYIICLYCSEVYHIHNTCEMKLQRGLQIPKIYNQIITQPPHNTEIATDIGIARNMYWGKGLKFWGKEWGHWAPTHQLWRSGEYYCKLSQRGFGAVSTEKSILDALNSREHASSGHKCHLVPVSWFYSVFGALLILDSGGHCPQCPVDWIGLSRV